MGWLHEQLGEDVDGDYYLFDCPGQIELYTHLGLMKTFIHTLESWSFRVCGVYTIDAHFLTDGTKFIAGAMSGKIESELKMFSLSFPRSVLTKILKN